MEDPAIAAPAGARSRRRRRARSAGYTTTPAIQTPTVNGQIDREVVLDRVDGPQSRERDVRRHGARVAARAVPARRIHPLGEMTFNPAARPGDPDWRVMYLGAGDSQSGEQRDSRRLNPQRLDTLVGKILRIVPDLARAHDDEHASARTDATASRTTIRSRPSTARAKKSGRTACAIRIG